MPMGLSVRKRVRWGTRLRGIQCERKSRFRRPVRGSQCEKESRLGCLTRETVLESRLSCRPVHSVREGELVGAPGPGESLIEGE